MTTTGVKVTIPDLEFHCPDCPLCGRETNAMDGCFDCESCNLTWSRSGDEGERRDPNLPACAVERSPYSTSVHELLRGFRYRCVLEDGHELPHRGVRVDEPDRDGDTCEWSDADPEPVELLQS